MTDRIDDLIQRIWDSWNPGRAPALTEVERIIREWAGEQVSTITHECGNCDMSWNEGEAPKHRTDCIAYVAPQPVAGDVRQRVARKMARQYWKGRGEEITQEMEDKFWLSFARNAEEILALLRPELGLREALERIAATDMSGGFEINGVLALAVGIAQAALASAPRDESKEGGR